MQSLLKSSQLSRPISPYLRATRAMNAAKISLSHTERTAEEPRDNLLYRVKIDDIQRINEQVRLLRLKSLAGEGNIKFLPGQWLDVHIPNLPKPGGFTITCPPSLAQPPTSSVELAIQASPSNPAAAYLWRHEPEILGSELQVRVGGSFIWPPKFHGEDIKRVVFVAGGVGINPLMAMLSHIYDIYDKVPFKVQVLYSVKYPHRPVRVEEILFLGRLWSLDTKLGKDWLTLFLTGNQEEGIVKNGAGNEIQAKSRRIMLDDVVVALGPVQERRDTVCYICGVPTMTDELVDMVQRTEGIDARHVLFERWW